MMLEVSNLSLRDFLDLVREHKSNYKHLIKFISDMQYNTLKMQLPLTWVNLSPADKSI